MFVKHTMSIEKTLVSAAESARQFEIYFPCGRTLFEIRSCYTYLLNFLSSNILHFR